jgi:glucose-6-phosphate isomerase/transaldolase/glucose-6-phosphate isomerase
LLDQYEDSIRSVLADLDCNEALRRIWERDHTVWKPDPAEISDRLGWLTVVGDMRKGITEIKAFADEVKEDGYRHIVLLGMGGSSLGSLAIYSLFGSAKGYPELIVLDTTVPDAIVSVMREVDCSKTLFIVASKSGTTIEPNVLYKYSRGLVEHAVGVSRAGRQFVAICDRGTALEDLGYKDGFRRVFLNPADIGGRYSVQSLFGIVPAALTGIEVDTLLARVEAMGIVCEREVSSGDNPGAWLGAAVASLALRGRDKLTVITTKSLREFGLWVEQLLAESTGKEGKGIIPIVSEPLRDPDNFGSDRAVVYVRLDGDATDDLDAYVDLIEGAGIPTIKLHLSDKYDVGAEFFRWEFATAVAGRILGIHPFDQPNVQRAKDNTTRLLADYHRTGTAPLLLPVSSLSELIAQSKPGDYLAITAFVEPTQEFKEAIARLRRRVNREFGIATTFGYGPRYLHSTGQLHKGGTESGLFLQLTRLADTDIRIPGETFTFRVLAAAQAKGDLDELASLGRPVARVDLGDDAARTIDEMTGEVI